MRPEQNPSCSLCPLEFLSLAILLPLLATNFDLYALQQCIECRLGAAILFRIHPIHYNFCWIANNHNVFRSYMQHCHKSRLNLRRFSAGLAGSRGVRRPATRDPRPRPKSATRDLRPRATWALSWSQPPDRACCQCVACAIHTPCIVHHAQTM